MGDADDRAVAWLKKNYKGWTSVRVLPPEQIKMQSFNFTDERIFELIPDSKTQAIIEKYQAGRQGCEAHRGVHASGGRQGCRRGIKHPPQH